MKLDRRAHKEIGETFFTGRHPSGLEVVVNPKKGFLKSFAILGSRFGSIDNRVLAVNGDRRETTLPDGLAHFLEHQVFADEEGDLFEKFARYGASSNAGTSFTNTSYYFSCTRSFPTNLSMLLHSVFTPYFTEEGVTKEKGIIGQEIRMYDDHAEWQIFMNLMEAIFHRHPVRIDIAGTVESIGRITPELLYAAHRIFYHPSNMVLVVVGEVDPRTVAERLDRFFRRRQVPEALPFDRVLPVEPRSVHRKRMERSGVISQPKYLLGIKDPDPLDDGPELLEREIQMSLLLHLLCGRSSDLYDRLYGSGLIDESFGASYSGESRYGFTTLGGDTDSPRRLDEEIRKGIRALRQRGIRSDDLRRVRRRLLGKFFHCFNSPESTAFTTLNFWFKRCDPWKYPEIVKRTRASHLEDRLRRQLNLRYAAISILRPSRR